MSPGHVMDASEDGRVRIVDGITFDTVAIFLGRGEHARRLARVMAAGPELLEACEAMLAAISFPLTVRESAAWELLRAAVDKARGERPTS